MFHALMCVGLMFAPVAWVTTLELNDNHRRRQDRRTCPPNRMGSIVWYM